MIFEDEHYVRVFTRDTKTWKRWGWEARCVFLLLIRKVDKAGILDEIDEPVSDVALMTELPEEVVSAGLPKLIDSGAVELHQKTLVIPRYIEAQTAPKSDKLRAQESRARRAADARVTNRDEVSQIVTSNPTNKRVTNRDGPVTNRDAGITNRDAGITNRDAKSRTVTPRHSTQCNAVQRRATQRSAESAPVREPADAPKANTRRKPKVPIPESWTPLPRHLAKATELTINCALAAEKFRGHAESVDRRCSDWNRAFDNWLLNEKPVSSAAIGPRSSFRPPDRGFDPFERAARLQAAEAQQSMSGEKPHD